MPFNFTICPTCNKTQFHCDCNEPPLLTIQYPSDLHKNVCTLLKRKRSESDYTINIKKMSDHFVQPETTLRNIINWYEANLISTKFEIV